MRERKTMKRLKVKLHSMKLETRNVQNGGTGTCLSGVFKAVAGLLHLTIFTKLIFSPSESLSVMTVFQGYAANYLKKQE